MKSLYVQVLKSGAAAFFKETRQRPAMCMSAVRRTLRAISLHSTPMTRVTPARRRR